MRWLTTLLLCLGLLAQPAFADTLAGRWSGAAPVSPGCDYESRVTLQTADGALHGQVRTVNGIYSLGGEAGADGSGTILVDHVSRGTLRLAGDRLVLDWRNVACQRHAELARSDTAPGRFDGAWQAERLAMAKPCNASTTLSLVVIGDQVMGEAFAPWGSSIFTATLDADGAGQLQMRLAKGAVRFSGDRFQMGWVGGHCGSEVALGDRVPDDARRAAMRRTREQAQDAFTNLVAAANAGRKLDYTALRAASVHNAQWAFFNNKAEAPMSQGELAAKGSDCDQALLNLDQAIAYDFTMDTAHALKADCLRKTDPRRARIEDAIANGLVRSLMTSGNGKSEKTAYVVTTGREIDDVLANRHIEVRTRHNETRGSDGHFYAVVQGLHVAGKRKTLQTVYFNIDAFVVGRQDKRLRERS